MKGEVVLDFKRITAEVAARQGMLVSPDDPAMLLVTMNEVVLQQVMGSIEARTDEIVVSSMLPTLRQNSKGDCVTHEGHVYISRTVRNVSSVAATPVQRR
jgi:hypothetical protein